MKKQEVVYQLAEESELTDLIISELYEECKDSEFELNQKWDKEFPHSVTVKTRKALQIVQKHKKQEVQVKLEELEIEWGF